MAAHVVRLRCRHAREGCCQRTEVRDAIRTPTTLFLRKVIASSQVVIARGAVVPASSGPVLGM
jgi:hypothetical protein